MYTLEKDPALRQDKLESSLLQYLHANHNHLFENSDMLDQSLFTGGNKQVFVQLEKHLGNNDLYSCPDLPPTDKLGDLGHDFYSAVKVLSKFSAARTLIGTLQQNFITARAIKKDDTVDINQIVTSCLETLTDARGKFRTGTKVINSSDAASGILRSLEQRQKDFKAGIKYPGLETRFNCHMLRRLSGDISGRHLDDLIGGLQMGVHCLAGQPGSGKTTLALNIAYQLSLNKIPTLFVSFEMPSDRMIIKSICLAKGIDESSLTNGSANFESVLDSFRDCRDQLKYINYVDADRNTTTDEIKTMAASIQAKNKSSKMLVVVDYLQLWAKLTRDEKSSGFDTNTLVSNMVGKIRAIAKELQIPILLLASQNRASQTSGRGSDLISLKDSGDIEYTADTAWFLSKKPRDDSDVFKTQDDNIEHIVLKISKNRYGLAPSECSFDFHKKHALFIPKGIGKDDFLNDMANKGGVKK